MVTPFIETSESTNNRISANH